MGQRLGDWWQLGLRSCETTPVQPFGAVAVKLEKETAVCQIILLIGQTKSCGCLQAKVVLYNMKFVDGASVTMLEKVGKRLISTNISGYNGIRWSKESQKWIAQIGFKGKTLFGVIFQN